MEAAQPALDNLMQALSRTKSSLAVDATHLRELGSEPGGQPNPAAVHSHHLLRDATFHLSSVRAVHARQIQVLQRLNGELGRLVGVPADVDGSVDGSGRQRVRWADEPAAGGGGSVEGDPDGTRRLRLLLAHERTLKEVMLEEQQLLKAEGIGISRELYRDQALLEHEKNRRRSAEHEVRRMREEVAVSLLRSEQLDVIAGNIEQLQRKCGL